MKKASQNLKDAKKNGAREAKPAGTGRMARCLPFWQKLLLPVISVLVFFLLLEGGLALFGVKPVLQQKDPFVGFAVNVPLFVPAAGEQGETRMVTARNKLGYFNRQSFAREKAAGTFRIFTLGGSTTYGRPYDDATSFSGWLRELLPVADGTRQWEVINAGGIGFASYRVAHLMEELIEYQPDLFVVYTGHNEFLEERTYGEVKDIPPVIRSVASLLSGTRTWTAMSKVMTAAGLPRRSDHGQPVRLGERVDAILDKSAGLDRYTRDDPLAEKIENHYRLSLERMVALARSAGAEVLFVTPASNLKDCSPFKSEHTPNLPSGRLRRLEPNLSKARQMMDSQQWSKALPFLQEAATVDPRHAEIQYLLGKSLFAMQRYPQAREALRRARDEDVCPLRALTAFRRIVQDVARQEDVALVDYVELLEQHMRQTSGHDIPGQELFLDHVHPTIEGHRLLAKALIENMAGNGLLKLGSDWNDRTIGAVVEKVASNIDQAAHGQALANLARVLLWAGKTQEAARLAGQAYSKAEGDRQVMVDAASILTTIYLETEEYQKARTLMYETLEIAPGAMEIRLKLGRFLIHPRFRNLEKAAAHLLLVCQQMPNYDPAFTEFSLAMLQRGRLSIAYNSLSEALRLNPGNPKARAILAEIEPALAKNNLQPVPFQVDLDIYPSNAPRQLRQLSRNAAGQLVQHGVVVEFFQNGRVKRFLDMAGGVKHGHEKIWDEEGSLISQMVYEHGQLVEQADQVTRR